MQFVVFCHSLLSDWNHGNAHFLRGTVTELVRRGHAVRTYEPREGWSITNLAQDHGRVPVEELHASYPELQHVQIERYQADALDLDAALDGADVVLVHEWNEPELIRALGRRRARGGRFRLLFHDTHHRSVTHREQMARNDLSAYDGVLAFGEAVRQVYLDAGWSRQAWTWHEAADVHVFRPLPGRPREGDLVWIGNWGDDERTAELRTFLMEPVRALGLTARVHGVRFPEEARDQLAASGIGYGGWLPNFRVPEAFARHRVTIHVPRRPYARDLPGIPTIRVFEALASGIPLITSPWKDVEELFRPGIDYLVANDGDEMKRHLREVLNDPDRAAELAARGRESILARHTCAHRVDQLLAVTRMLGVSRPPRPVAGAASIQEGVV